MNTLSHLLAGALLVSASLAQGWTVDAQGWTDLTTFPHGQDVYVSWSSGNNANSGLYEWDPKKDIADAVSLLRSGFPDWLHIKRGALEIYPYSFTGNLPSGSWTKSGLSANAPMVVTTYGTSTERPRFDCGDNTGLAIHWSVHDVAFVGLDLSAQQPTAPPYNNPYGISLLCNSGSSSQHLLFEDFRVAGFCVGVRFQGDPPTTAPFPTSHYDISLRRSLVIDSYTLTTAHAQGIFAEWVDTLLLEECLFDHNGWSEDPNHIAYATIFRHNVYIQGTCANVTLRGNISARAGAHGIMCRPGGDIRYNLMLRNPINMIIGFPPSYGTPPEGVMATVVGNVVIDSADIKDAPTSTLPRGWSMLFMHLASGDIHHNICAWNQFTSVGNQKRSYHFDTSDPTTVGINQTDFHDNRSYDWRGPICFSHNRLGSPSSPTGLRLRSNDIQEPWIPVPIISALDPNNVPGPPGLSSDNNQGYSILAPAPPSGGWCNWPGPMYFSLLQGTPNWQHTIMGESTSTAVQVGYPPPDSALPVLPNPSIGSGQGNIEWFLAECRLQSRQYWRPEFLATSLVYRYGTRFGLVIP